MHVVNFVFGIFQDYPTDEVLVVYDPDYKHGQNFIVATTEEAKQALLQVGRNSVYHLILQC